MTTNSMVAASNPTSLSSCAIQLQQKTTQLDALIKEYGILADLAASWKGDAASAAIASGKKTAECLIDIRDCLEKIRVAPTAGGTNLAALRTEVINVATQALRIGGNVSDDGTVTPTGFGELLTPTTAAAFTIALQALLHQFDATDKTLSAALRQAVSGLTDHHASYLGDLSASPPPKPDIDTLKPPEGATDTEVNQWWDGLSKEDQDRIIAERPEWVGNLDGVPGVARDRANRIRLEQLRRDPKLTEKQRQTIEQIDLGLARGGCQLLVLDFDGEYPKVALAIGDVDTADHVSVYVPGTGAITQDNPTDGNDLPAYVEQAEWLKTDTEQVLEKAGKARSVATVTWLGYEPPADVREAASAHYADDNAPKLASFINGLSSGRDTDPHLTVLGHSYGSTLASEALQRGTAADDAVFMGSPGLETNSFQFLRDTTPSDLHLSEGHVFVEHAKNDIVANLGRFGVTVPSSLPGFIDLSTNAEATRLGDRGESTGHSRYSFAGTTALYNQAVVVAGLAGTEDFLKPED